MEQQDSFALHRVLIRRCVILNIAVKSFWSTTSKERQN